MIPMRRTARSPIGCCGTYRPIAECSARVERRTETTDGGVRQGKNSFGRLGYGGPAPPPGPQHRYLFKLYALNTVLGLDGGATKEQLIEAFHNHILGEGILTGMYGRRAREVSRATEVEWLTSTL